MNEKIDQGNDQAIEATETTASPVAEPRKPLVLRRQVVRELSVRTGLLAGKKCLEISIFSH